MPAPTPADLAPGPRRLGASGLVVSRIGLGTLTWGGDTTPEEATQQLAAFRDAGGTLVSTSDAFVGGEAERVLGRLLFGRTRGEVVLAGSAGGSASRAGLLSALDSSLRRLRTDHLDLWGPAGYDPAVPLEETLAALDHAVSSGRVRYATVGGYTGGQAARAAAWQQAWPVRAPLAAVALEYSLLQRGIEREALPAATAAGMGLLAWAPLGRGVLTGKYRGGVPADSRGASPVFAPFVEPYLSDPATRVVDAVLTAADGLGVPPLAVALAWVADRPGVSTSVVGARSPAQLLGVLAAAEMGLPAEIRAALDDVSAPVLGYPEVPLTGLGAPWAPPSRPSAADSPAPAAVGPPVQEESGHRRQAQEGQPDADPAARHGQPAAPPRPPRAR